MILSLRRRHRRIFFALGVILPVVLIVGIAARKPVPVLDSLPGALAAAPPHFKAAKWTREDIFTKVPVHVHLFRELEGKGDFAVGFTAPRDFLRPDLIVYWTSENTKLTDALPNDAHLLGVFNSSLILPLPAKAAISVGMLVLYSLADHEIVDVSKPFAVSEP